MMHERFRYRNGDELTGKARELGYSLPFSDDMEPLFSQCRIGDFTTGNRFVVQPMEGYDSENDGSPSALTKRRYLRYASGGSGTIWFEAVSVVREGRSNPHQLWIHSRNRDEYARLNDEIRRIAGLSGTDPLIIVQLTHSGRYSKPEGIPKPLTAFHNPLLDTAVDQVLTDDDLKRLADRFVEAAKLSYRAGFNAADLKACHGYLLIELLAAKARKDSVFGGEDASARFRYLLELYDRIRDEVPGLILTTRLGISDLYKGGFGVDEEGIPDFSEPLMLVRELVGRGMKLLNVTMGSPYYNPHVNRPYDNPVPGQKKPDEHPLEGVMRMLEGTRLFQKSFPGTVIAGSAYSWLRHFAPNVGSAVIRDVGAALIGFGRNSFAYPSMPAEIKVTGSADPRKTCITCSGCTRLIKGLRPGGCVIHDREIYGEELKKLIESGK